MGLIIDNNNMYEKFKNLLNKKCFVDKSNIINLFNKLICVDGSNNICITKPRRFGKTSIAALLVTYYSKGINSQDIFDNLKVSRGIDFQELFDNKINEEKNNGKKITKEYEKEIKEKVEEEIREEKDQYKKFQGKYHTLYFDFSCNVESYKTLKEYLNTFNSNLKQDIEDLFPNSEILKYYNENICTNLERVYNETGEKFIIIIDEWDYIISNRLFTYEERDKYISFLKDLIKDREYVAFVYMTGILPIAKELSQSTLNCFTEYCMLNDEKYFKYFGFTEQEVRDLCDNDERKYKNLENWYNGYKVYNGEKIFNTWSVTHALDENKIKNFWTDTGRFDELIHIINFNIDGIKDEILDLIKGKEISIKLKKYGALDLQNKSEENKPNNDEMNEKGSAKNKPNNDVMKKALYSKMVTFGFLTYYDGKISIPNNELKEKFIDTLGERSDMRHFYELIKNSNKMLERTLEKDVKAMCELFEEAHLKKILPRDKMDHGNLKRVIDFAYFNAPATYDVYEEESKGKGTIDFLFCPKDQTETLFILELKLNMTAKQALKQIYEKKYYHNLKREGYSGHYLLIGLNLNTEEKIYSCEMDECDCNLDFISKYSYIPSKSEKRSKNDLESDGIFKRLRSDDIFKRLRSDSKNNTK